MDNPLPPLAALRAFALVAETGSLTAAAARLNVTQPAVSRRLRELEETLGLRLVHRGANALRLTEAGAQYAAALAEAFARIEAATAALGGRVAAPLRIRAYNTLALRWLIPRLPKFRALHDGLEVEVLASTSNDVDFARDALDAAIRSAPSGRAPAPGALRLNPLHIAPYATPALARRQRGGAEPLAGLSLLGSRIRPADWSIWFAAQGRAGLPAVPLLFESTSLAIQGALEGLGAVICGPAMVADDVRRRRLSPLATGAAPTGEHYWLMLPPGVPRPEALAFRDWLLEEAGVAAVA
ncbi:LysR family transcriptional regulator [Humitalea sp. 24SJ18S-53]|uniref:LysR family transcriptional regulator n=1 Tax=Humitalea sp. 24SJ18S-53 TaxID=3422307 RepID=UPI003D664FF3